MPREVEKEHVASTSLLKYGVEFPLDVAKRGPAIWCLWMAGA
jgi:hypothetical protein